MCLACCVCVWSPGLELPPPPPLVIVILSLRLQPLLCFSKICAVSVSGGPPLLTKIWHPEWWQHLLTSSLKPRLPRDIERWSSHITSVVDHWVGCYAIPERSSDSLLWQRSANKSCRRCRLVASLAGLRALVEAAIQYGPMRQQGCLDSHLIHISSS